MFAHLHVHTQYSMLQGMIRVEDLCARVKELGMPAVAITDTHGLFGAVHFYFEAKKKGIQPIFGCEARYQSHSKAPVSSVVLLAKNLKGYRNICDLLTQSYLDLAELKRKDLDGDAILSRTALAAHADGVVFLSGGLKGPLSRAILEGREKDAQDEMDWFRGVYQEDFYLELCSLAIPEQDLVNETLDRWGRERGIRRVATSNAHYLHPTEAVAQEVLQCIGSARNLDFDRPASLVPSDFYLKSPEEMQKQMGRYEGALEATLEIASKCKVEFQFKDANGKPIYHLPNFRPEGVAKTDPFDLIEYFRKSAREGLQARYREPQFEELKARPEWPELAKSYEARLEDELQMIERTGFAGYFLIVADFINWAKGQGIPVGPGRGSGAGSLVAYSLRITDIDSIQFNLLFERFINPERISMPDFDIDFCQDRRGEVIDYVKSKYGEKNVCQIITFGQLQARAVVKDVGRVFGLSFADTDQLTKLIPRQLDITVAKAIEAEPRLRERMEQDPRIAQVIGLAQSIEGMFRGTGIHAAGVIITENPVSDYCPLFVGRDPDVVIQLDKDYAEKIGLVKFDFLGLKTLTVIDNAIRLLKLGAEPGSAEACFDLARIDYRDPAVFALLSDGDTSGVFQVEGGGMTDLCARLKPSSLEDLTAIGALYRPGPLGSGMLDDFIERKHGRKSIEYDIPQLEPILRETYGVILYQEQVMRIARELAGYSLGQADLLRRAMGKKLKEEMDRQRATFVEGALKRGIDGKKAEAIFGLMEKFAEYGFNKSHSAAYGVITYQTAYLKTHHTAEFLAALLTTEINDTDKLTTYIGDARAHGIEVLPPSVNRSGRTFSVEIHNGKRAIRYGLEGIKGVGGAAVDAMIEARSGSQGPFSGVIDFCRRVSARKVNKRVLEALIFAGAFDEIAEANRASLHASLDSLVEFSGAESEEREIGQASLFDAFNAEEVKLITPQSAVIRAEADWTDARKLSLEKQVLGFYLSGHPMDPWQKLCEEGIRWNTENLAAFLEEAPPAAGKGFGGGGTGWSRPQRPEVMLAGVLAEMREVRTKKGTLMGIGTVEDLKGRAEVIVFPEAYAASQETLKLSLQGLNPIVIAGEGEVGERLPKILVRSVETVQDWLDRRVQKVLLRLDPDQVKPEQLREAKRIFLKNPGKLPVVFEFTGKEFRTTLELGKLGRVAGTPALVDSINRVFGRPVVVLQ